MDKTVCMIMHYTYIVHVMYIVYYSLEQCNFTGGNDNSLAMSLFLIFSASLIYIHTVYMNKGQHNVQPGFITVYLQYIV